VPSRRPRAQSRSSATKLFVLDTNVLMHDPTSLFRFEEHDVFLPIMTLEELDNNKSGISEIARNARQASRFLDDIVSHAKGPIADGIPLARHKPTTREGVSTCRPRRSTATFPPICRSARPTTTSSAW